MSFFRKIFSGSSSDSSNNNNNNKPKDPIDRIIRWPMSPITQQALQRVGTPQGLPASSVIGLASTTASAASSQPPRVLIRGARGTGKTTLMNLLNNNGAIGE